MVETAQRAAWEAAGLVAEAALRKANAERAAQGLGPDAATQPEAVETPAKQ